ncbi:MAG: sulfotransferase [Clostridia bacterium]|nr:sulfotransferase [Deltaproteobacteria bacterium]
MLHENLIILVGAPRSGTTMLQRVLGSHSQIFTHPEPHVLTPLAYLGFYDIVEKAPYDHINAAEALRELVDELPAKEDDYLEALRAYPSALYAKLLATSGKSHFLDKTPAYALVLPFITKLFPSAKYVVLTRHPMAVWHSQAHSFFGGDYHAALEKNPLVQPYVDAIGRFLLAKNVPYVHVRYDDLVTDPEAHTRRIFEHLGLPHEAHAVDYGEHQHITKSFGDPTAVEKHQKPVTDSLETWAQDMKTRPEVLELARSLERTLDPKHLEAWGYPSASFFGAVDKAQAQSTKKSSVQSYALKRRVLLGLRENMQKNATLRASVRKIRYYCDVLLRT